jgi:probable HAF family extracellular repeat protein
MRTLSKFAAALALASTSATNAAVTYTLTNLGGLGGTLGSRGAAVGPTNLVAGTAYTPANASLNGLSFLPGSPVTRTNYGPLVDGSNSYGTGVGGVGGETVVGFSQTTDRAIHAMIGSAGVATNLHTSSLVTSPAFATSTNSRAFGINAAGDVVGHAKVGSAFQPFYLPAGGPAVAIAPLPTYTDGLASAVNDAGTVVGFSYTGAWTYSLAGSIGGAVTQPMAFSWDNGTLTSLGTLGGLASIATSVNSAGVIVGQSTLASAEPIDTKGRAFIYENGAMTQLNEIAGAIMSLANDINDTGDIVGTVKTPAGSKAFLYRNDVMIDLNSLIAPAGWVLREATSINADGYITGYGTFNGQTTAFLLSPIGQANIPEPTSAVLLGLAGIALAGQRRWA